jgi:hypothetical protein
MGGDPHDFLKLSQPAATGSNERTTTMGGRPKNGYVNALGQKIPGTHDPLKRFTNPGGLIAWAHKRGTQGLPLYDNSAIDIGKCVHQMAELDLKGATERQIEKCAHDFLAAPDHLMAAWSCFREFRDWRKDCHVRAIAQEVPLVSERWSFGGTPDTIALIGNRLGLLDFKTAENPRVYPDMWLVMRAHGELWEENYPDRPLNGGYHLILLPKSGGKFQHHVKERDELETEWRIYTLLLEAYRLEKDGPAAVKNVATMNKPVRAPKAKPTPREKITPRIEQAPRFQTMGELLRAWHVKEGVPA